MPTMFSLKVNSGFAMTSGFKDLHQSSTLPSISDAHLFPVGVRKAGDEVRAEPRRRKAMHGSSPDMDQEAKARRQAQLDQRHLEVYRNMHRLRDALYRRYAALLRDKVHSQRLLLQQRDETVRVKSENYTKQKQRKLAFVKLQHNDSYLESLPKTSYYLIFDLQRQLAEHGHLKTHHDLEDFYGHITYNCPPSQLQKSLEDVRKRMLESRPVIDLMTQYKTSEKHPCTAEDRGHEGHGRWRLPTLLLEQGSGSTESSVELIFSGNQEKDEIEQMFPKMKVPTFATLQPNFMRSFQSKMPDLIIPEVPEKSRKAEIYLRRLRHMYALCLTNMAVSQRLLDRETDSLCWQEEGGNQDLMLPSIESKQGKTGKTNQPPPCSPKQPKVIQNDRLSSPWHLSRTTSASHQCSETLVWDTAVCCCKTPDPLSIEDVCQQKHVEVIDRGFKLWRNYTVNTDH
ncbi:uncharacterized protein LOC117247839 [Epinephelus lanceolatus]|uniref:uncharacterized protein si:ch211-130h14.4 isoform X2 n=1 Tax=Epinephelus lanceolatus TaxID=310571 RepID=UPI0014487987|nr:uncharacterized protein si:ch211-130h14.4 isoform X2 [Epinephelus lanceolatus]